MYRYNASGPEHQVISGLALLSSLFTGASFYSLLISHQPASPQPISRGGMVILFPLLLVVFSYSSMKKHFDAQVPLLHRNYYSNT